MGRSGRQNNSQASGLRSGRDLQGVERRLGEADSSGKKVGYIDTEGNCWETVLEHDIVLTEAKYDDAMEAWGRNGGAEPSAKDIARAACADENNIEKAAEAAIESRKVFMRLRASGPFVDKKVWESVGDHDSAAVVDAYIDAAEAWEESGRSKDQPVAREIAENLCLNPDNISAAAEAAEKEWSVVRQRRAASGLPISPAPSQYQDGVATYPGLVPGSQIELVQDSPGMSKSLEKNVGKFIEKLREKGIEVQEREPDNFEQIIDGIELEEAGSWQASFSYHVDAMGHTVSAWTVRSDGQEAYLAGRALEEAIMHGGVTSDAVSARVVLEGKTPQEQQDEALQRLAQGPKRKDLAIMEALGLDAESVLRRDEAIASGRHIEQPLALVEGDVFLPGLGQVRVVASGRSSEEALLHLQKVLPGAEI